jgi:hypothetical protein
LIQEAIIRPAVTYACPIWAASLSTTQLKTLQIDQNKTLRIIKRGRWFHTNAALHYELEIQRFNECLIETAKHFKKSLLTHPNPSIKNQWSINLDHPQNTLHSSENFPTKRKKTEVLFTLPHRPYHHSNSNCLPAILPRIPSAA